MLKEAISPRFGAARVGKRFSGFFSLLSELESTDM